MPSLGSNAAGAGMGAPPQCATTSSEQVFSPATASRLAALTAEHDDLDVAISVLLEMGKRDDLLITRLKKRKLQIKDEIALAAPGLHQSA